jgi:hypothetical protein
MNDIDRATRATQLNEMVATDGWQVVASHIEEEIVNGWEEFIKLPVAQKTNKAAYNYQAKYEVLKDLKEWITSEIKMGQ